MGMIRFRNFVSQAICYRIAMAVGIVGYRDDLVIRIRVVQQVGIIAIDVDRLVAERIFERRRSGGVVVGERRRIAEAVGLRATRPMLSNVCESGLLPSGSMSSSHQARKATGSSVRVGRDLAVRVGELRQVVAGVAIGDGAAGLVDNLDQFAAGVIGDGQDAAEAVGDLCWIRCSAA